MQVRILLCGLKHSGKSTLAELMGERFDMPFFDLDQIALAAANDAATNGSAASSAGLGSQPGPPATQYGSVRELYLALGKPGFQRFEAEAARRLAAEPPPFVAALGGGTVENGSAVDALSGAGLFVYLEEDVETLYRRVVQGGLPPFLDTEDPHGSFRRLCERRGALYAELADLTVSLRGRDIDQAAALLEQQIKGYIDAGK